MLRAKTAMGAIIRDALAQAGVDPARAPRLRLADEAALALAALPDPPVPPGAAAVPELGPDPDPFAAKMLALAQRFADGGPPDFAAASFAELFAWSLARKSGAVVPKFDGARLSPSLRVSHRPAADPPGMKPRRRPQRPPSPFPLPPIGGRGLRRVGEGNPSLTRSWVRRAAHGRKHPDSC